MVRLVPSSFTLEGLKDGPCHYSVESIGMCRIQQKRPDRLVRDFIPILRMGRAMALSGLHVKISLCWKVWWESREGQWEEWRRVV